MSAHLDDVLDALSMEETVSRETLGAYLKRYPEFAVEITDLFHEIRLVNLDIENEQTELRSRSTIKAPTELSYEPASVFSGENLKTLARALGLPRYLLTAIRDRIIVVATIPDALIRAIAEHSGVELSSLRSHLQDGQTPRTALAFKSESKPKHNSEQMTFKEFLEQSRLSPDEQEQLLARYGCA